MFRFEENISSVLRLVLSFRLQTTSNMFQAYQNIVDEGSFGSLWAGMYFCRKDVCGIF